MEFLEENPDVKKEVARLMTEVEDQVARLRKTDVESFRRKIEQASDLQVKSMHFRSLLETNIPACVDLLERLLQKSQNDKLQYLEWMSQKQQVVMSLESFSRARVLAEEAYRMAKDLYQDLENKQEDTTLPRIPTYKAYLKACINLLLVCRFQGKIADAQVYLEEAKSLAAAEKDDDDKDHLLILNGDLLLAKGQLNKAIDAIFKPLLCKSNISLQNKGLLLQKLGNSCRSAAQWGSAKEYLRQSIQIAKDLGDSISEFDRVTDLGNVYRSEGRIADALEHQVAHIVFAFNRGDLWGITIAYFNMGFAYYSITPKPDLRRALILLSLKHDLAARTENEPLRGMALNNLGKVFCALGQYEMALKVMTQSVEVAKKTLNIAGEGMAYGNIGTAHRSLGKYDDAIENHTKYLLNASGRGDDGGVAIMQRELAIDYLCKGYLENAEKQVRDAISTLEIIRNKLGSEDTSKIANFDKNQAETYSLLQVILTRRGKHSEALALSELSRSRALTDLIRDRLIKDSGTVNSSWIYDSDLSSRHQDLERDILSDYISSADQLNTNFLIYSVLKDYNIDGTNQQVLYIWVVLKKNSSKGGERVHFERVILNEKVKSELVEDSGFFASLTRSFRLLSIDGKPVYSKLKKDDAKKANDSDNEKMRLQIPENPAVTKFLSLLKSLSLTSIEPSLTNANTEKSDTPTRDIIHESKDLEDYNEKEDPEDDRAELIMERLMERGSWAKDGIQQLLQLYDVCIAPIDGYLPDYTEEMVPNVTIIPHEFLFSIPFCCLHNGHNKYLIERYVLNYAPSLRALLLLNERMRYLKNQQRSRELKLLAMGDAKMVLPDIKELPYSGDEARNLQAVFGSEQCQVALRNDATKRLLLQELKNVDILHVATHACPQDIEVRSRRHRKEIRRIFKDMVGDGDQQGDYSMRGCLLLASSDDECEGIVEALEISSCECTCQLVTLSCCETGLGKVTGDGVIGLYRAFFAAGAASVLVTLWKIRDDITPIFMKHFYNEFKTSGNVSTSLRSAMIHCICDKHLPPQQWAAFSLIGAFS